MKQIILDTNFLMIPAMQKVDIFYEIEKLMEEPYDLYILDRSVEELKKINLEQKGKNKNAAKLALQLIDKKNIKVVTTKQKSLYMPINSKEFIVDDILLDISDKNTLVATQDSLLKKRLSEKGVKLIILRGKKKLEIR